MEQKTYKLWKSGLPTDNTGHWSGMPVFMGKMEGTSFNDAVNNYVNELPETSRGFYTQADGHWYYCSTLRICETHDDAVAYKQSQMEPPEKRITVWKEGYDASGNHCSAQHLFDANGPDLNSVIEKFVNGITDSSRDYWRFDVEQSLWRHWGCRTFDNEADARKTYG